MTYLGEEMVSMAKLTHLFLDHMSLQDVANTAVLKSPNLLHLDLSHNQLRVLQPFSEGSAKLTRLNLAANPIYCNCYLRPLRYQQTDRQIDLLIYSLQSVLPFSATSKSKLKIALPFKAVVLEFASSLFRSCHREWAIRGKVKLIGSCGGPAHLSGENLEAVYPAELRCQSQEAMLKAEYEEATRISPPPTEEPANKVKCPANCVCEVKKGVGT